MKRNICLEDLYSIGLTKETFYWVKENNLFSTILKNVRRQMILSFIERKKCFDMRSIVMKKARNAGLSWELVNRISFQISFQLSGTNRYFDRVFAEKLENQIIIYLFEKYAERFNSMEEVFSCI